MSTLITETLMKSFQPVKSFNYHKHTSITSLDFDDSGQFLISSGVDESIQLYDCRSGKHVKSIYSKKYGTHLARFTHHEKNCIYASTKVDVDNTIRYLSLHDNQYIRYFKGHKALVNSLEVSPLQDVFISSSYDDSVRFWDLRSPTAQGYLQVKSPSFTAFDPSGIVFAIGCAETGKIALYDVRNFDKEPFSVFKTEEARKIALDWTKLEFTNDSKNLIVVNKTGDHLVLDAFTGSKKASLQGAVRMNQRDYPDNGSLTVSPDGRFAYVGSGNGDILIYDLHQADDLPSASQVLKPIQTIYGSRGHESLPRSILFNPKLLVFATANEEVQLFLPDSTK